MNKIILSTLACFLSFIIINGCAVRTYQITKERTDQNLSEGNRGYILGRTKLPEQGERKATRQLQVVEVEIRPRKAKEQPISYQEVSSAMIKESSKEAEGIVKIKPIVSRPVESSKVIVTKKYTVQKGDTLQRIAKKFYGTTKRWKDIYQANQKVLKSPDKLYPGQIIEIPVEEVLGTK